MSINFDDQDDSDSDYGYNSVDDSTKSIVDITMDDSGNGENSR